MKLKRGFEANNATGNTSAGDCDAVFKIKRSSWSEIQATIKFGEKTQVHCPPYNLMVNTMLTEFAERDDPLSAAKFSQAIEEGGSSHSDVSKKDWL